jgi:hypothetical protein
MPRGKKVMEAVMVQQEKPALVVESPKPTGPVYPPHVAESRKALLQPLGAGQAFFEAPDGYIVVGEADRPHAIYRQGNNGRGMKINQMR